MTQKTFMTVPLCSRGSIRRCRRRLLDVIASLKPVGIVLMSAAGAVLAGAVRLRRGTTTTGALVASLSSGNVDRGARAVPRRDRVGPDGHLQGVCLRWGDRPVGLGRLRAVLLA